MSDPTTSRLAEFDTSIVAAVTQVTDQQLLVAAVTQVTDQQLLVALQQVEQEVSSVLSSLQHQGQWQRAGRAGPAVGRLTRP